MCRLCLFLIFLFLLFEATAQKIFCGELEYDVEYVDLPSDMAGLSGVLPDKCRVITDGENWRLERNTDINGVFIEIYRLDRDSIYQFLTIADERVRIEKKTNASALGETWLISSDESIVAGLTVQKRSLRNPPDISQDIWVSKEYKAIPNLFFQDLDHLPLQFEMQRQGINMRYTLVQLKLRPLDETYFSLPDNYKSVSENIYQSWLR